MAKGNSQMEISTREKLLQTISRYIIITLSISIMTIGVYFFKFPNNFVFGGVTGGAALVAKLTPLSASAFSSWANVILSFWAGSFSAGILPSAPAGPPSL